MQPRPATTSQVIVADIANRPSGICMGMLDRPLCAKSGHSHATYWMRRQKHFALAEGFCMVSWKACRKESVHLIANYGSLPGTAVFSQCLNSRLASFASDLHFPKWSRSTPPAASIKIPTCGTSSSTGRRNCTHFHICMKGSDQSGVQHRPFRDPEHR